MQDTFTNTPHKQLIHRTSSMRANDNHVYIGFRCLLQNRFRRCALYKKCCYIQAFVAQSICNLLYLAMFSVNNALTRSPGLIVDPLQIQ